MKSGPNIQVTPFDGDRTLCRKPSAGLDLQACADGDLARRGLLGSFVYVLLWLVIVGSSEFRDVPRWFDLSIGAGLLLTGAARLVLIGQFDRLYCRHPHRWRLGFALAGILAAGFWGAWLATEFALQGLGTTAVLLLVATAGICSGAVVTLSPSRILVTAHLAAMLLPSVPVSLLDATVSGYGVAGLLVAYYTFMTLVGRRLVHDYWEALEARARLKREASELARAHEQLRESGSRLHALIENVPDGVLMEDGERRVVLANRAFCELFGIGLSPEALAGTPGVAAMQDRASLLSDPAAFEAGLHRLIGAGAPVHGEELDLADGRTFERDYVPVRADEQFHGHLWLYRDVSARKRAARQLEYLAHHDELTGLPNRLLFQTQLRQALARAERARRCLAVMFLDLDHFKEINDAHGHGVGDGLVRAAAARLRGCLREGDTIARWGGDEFAVLLEDIGCVDDARPIAEKIVGAFAVPFEIGERSLRVTTSIGVCAYPHDGGDEHTLLRNADHAMYQAKDLGRNRYRVHGAPQPGAGSGARC